MDINVYTTPTYADLSRLTQAISLMNGVQTEFRFALRTLDEAEVKRLPQPLTSDPALALIEGLDSNAIFVTDSAFDDNWFMHESRSVAVISTADWERIYAPPSLRAYLIYQMVQACGTFSGDLSETMLLNFAHEPPRGCLHDLCMDKRDIRLGMVAGAMCAECVSTLLQYGITGEQIDAMRRLLMLVRREALGTPRPFDPTSVFVVMRFSEFDENANAYKYGVKEGIERAGLTCHRADDEYTAGSILTKVMDYIKRSRVIVVKVDHPNLNVYYELGVARALDKDVILVAAQDLLGLPTDINNIECVTYQQGNYDGLATRVERALAPFTPRT